MLFLIAGLILIGYLWIKQNPDANIKFYRWLAYCYLWTKRRFSTPKFNFDPKSKNIDQLGVVSLPAARTVECPRPLDLDTNALDSVRFFGVNSAGAAISVQLDRGHGRRCEASVYLRLPDGDQYQLPGLPDSRVYNTHEHRFSAAGLTFHVLEPLRKWRITFNGHLRKRIREDCYTDDNDDDVVLVRFNFLWTPINNYQLFPDDFNIDYMSTIVATSPGIKRISQLSEHFPVETLEQTGQLFGTINIGDQPEQQMLVRGIKKRRHGIFNSDKINYTISIEGYLNNATSFHLFAENIDGGIPNFVYGYVNLPCNMKVHHISKCKFDFEELMKEPHQMDKIDVKFTAGGRQYNLHFQSWNTGFSKMCGEQWKNKETLRLGEVVLNGKMGQGAIQFICSQDLILPPFKHHSLPLLQESDLASCLDFTVSFRETACRSSKFVGGKGSSLALMTCLDQFQKGFSVPPGFCVTQQAFVMHLKDNPKLVAAIKQMENVAWKRVLGNLSDECINVVNATKSTSISIRLKEELRAQLLATFGENHDKLKLAVRSSALGEDGEEMSAAGQNETVLGVKGFEKILSAVITCWASQFSYRSIEYKRQNGQLLNGGMGVVVQQMVPADVAGVLFSRDPLTGSLGSMIISSNYGLGESVVSALADPDTITIKRSWNDKLSIDEKQIGKKNVMITMSDDGTVEQEVSTDKSSVCTVSDEDALRLADIALFLEKCFGSGRDIEWAIHNGNIYLLQSRPVTNENALTEFELIHEFDSAMRTDEEHFSTANIGEVLPGAISPLTTTSGFRYLTGYMERMFSYRTDSHRFDPIVMDSLSRFNGRWILDRIQQKTWTLEEEKTILSKAMDVGIYGRVLDDQNVCQKALERFEDPPLSAKIRIMSFSFKGMIYGWLTLRNASNFYNNYKPRGIDLKSFDDVYQSINKSIYEQEEALHAHFRVTFASNIFNILTFSAMSGSKDLSQDNYSDFANLIGSGNGALSGEVPIGIRELARTIVQEKDAKEFCSMSQEDALKWLESNTASSGEKYREFLKHHGHRGMQEFDLYIKSWGMNPIPLIKVLQDTAKFPAALVTDEPKLDDIGSEKTQVSGFRKIILPLFIKGARMAICHREQTKSWLIKYFDCLRRSYRHLADLMVKEGFLPDPDLLFFLSHEEISILYRTRSANLLRLAKQRHRIYPTLNMMKLPEMIDGYPVPIDENVDIVLDNMNQITGFPVSKGIVKGPAKVVASFIDVHTIEPGDILITFGTDIGWSPYFPMLAGVVTEIGGLISHGAVVAREFGLPCIVGAQHATKLFKSGDIVLLDATAGVISKVIE